MQRSSNESRNINQTLTQVSEIGIKTLRVFAPVGHGNTAVLLTITLLKGDQVAFLDSFRQAEDVG